MTHQQAVNPEERLCCVAQTRSGVGDTVMHIHLIALKSQAIISEADKNKEKGKSQIGKMFQTVPFGIMCPNTIQSEMLIE